MEDPIQLVDVIIHGCLIGLWLIIMNALIRSLLPPDDEGKHGDE